MPPPHQYGVTHNWQPNRVHCPDILDVTLRDGFQGIFPRYPSLEEKLRLVDLLLEVGVGGFEIGFPAAGHLHSQESHAIAAHIDRSLPGARIVCLARTRKEDVARVAALADRLGRQIGVGIFVGTSRLRQLVEGWTQAELLDWVQTSVGFAAEHKLEITFICEDATRSDPATLYTLYDAALTAGATRLAIPDTVGICTPSSADHIVRFVRNQIVGDRSAQIEWHGHDDRALGVANALAAVQAGADCIHATVLGIGERCGNVPLEPFLVTCAGSAAANYRLDKLTELAHYTAAILNVEVPAGYPVVGSGAYATAAGTHAAAIAKAEQMDRPDLAALAYAGIDPAMVGAAYDIVIGPFSGRANVNWRVTQMGLDMTEADVHTILEIARREARILNDDDVRAIIAGAYGR